MSSEAGSTPRLRNIVYTVEENVQTLTVCNLDVPDRIRETLVDYFDGQSVTLGRQSVASMPSNFAVLHDGGEFVAASSVRDVYRAIKHEEQTNDPDDIEVPDVIEAIDETAFTSYDKLRMIGASRRVERAAWELGEGELHTGFQTLEKAKSQWRLYTKLSLEVDTHLYGAPDWDVPPTDIILHGYDDAEITESWFVVLDAPDDAHKRALLAEERGPNEFHGFWTDETSVVDAILDRLRAEYPPQPVSP